MTDTRLVTWSAEHEAADQKRLRQSYKLMLRVFDMLYYHDDARSHLHLAMQQVWQAMNELGRDALRQYVTSEARKIIRDVEKGEAGND